MTVDVSVESVRARIAEIQGMLPAQRSVATRPVQFETALASAMSSTMVSDRVARGADVGDRMVQAARAELGQAELGETNDSRRIAQYREATEWSPVGPWCAYFASWAAKQAGAPLGDRGQGFARVADVWEWGQSSGRAVSPATRPKPGDLAIMDHHMGIVEAVLPDGRIQTIEGNKDDKVTRTVRGRDELIGFVRVG